ncbi:Imelysin [Meiothermus luteus]|uniref:Imelysin n=1 Tax=Meiothermus luteus TaxID=2026184 RepID=A0A399ERD9_9DEIN|nr:imelysin family protein [Meiothermus luteus]RIH87207.1 Imelysin [Meiothermus luteus]
MRVISVVVWALLGLAQAQGVEAVKGYLIGRVEQQKAATAALVKASQDYFALAQKAGFDYRKLAQAQPGPLRQSLQAARAAWVKASPIYESVEGIVAGVESLADFDLNLDAGASAAEGGDAVVTFDLKLEDGRVLRRPGNAFGVLEGTLWGTERAFSSGVRFDVDGDGKLGFGDYLPDAYVLKAGAAKLDELTGGLLAAAQGWKPTPSDVFGALVANVPTAASVFVARWKTSRFVLGEKATRRDFNVISSLDDLVNNIRSWQELYGGVSSLVRAKNPALDRQIAEGLSGLRAYAERLVAQEKTRRFSLEQAELIYKEADNRATAVTGKLAQAAALLGFKVGQ